MTANDRFDRDLRSWLEADAPTRAPVGLHDAAIERAGRSRQRPGWFVAVRRGTLGGSFGTLARPGMRATYLLIILALTLALVVAAIAASAFRSDPLRLGRNGAIAYSVEDRSERNQRFHAHLMNADGTGDRVIGPGSCPTFSGDGEALAYVSTAFGAAEVNVAAADGSSPRVLPAALQRSDSDYAFSADGMRIAWTKRVPPNAESSPSELWVSPVSGGPGIRVVPASADVDRTYASPVWSPDGRQLAFATLFLEGDDRAAHAVISIVDADGSNLRPLTSRPLGRGISWSPDGRSIAYVGLPDGSPPPSSSEGVITPLDIFVINVDGTDDRNLTSTEIDESGPEWAPDGAHLAYQSSQDGGELTITTVRMDGRSVVGSPVRGPGSDGFTWSPDGTTLLLLQALPGGTPSDPEAVRSAILSVDADLRGPPTTLRVVDYAIPCAPSWQRVEP